MVTDIMYAKGQPFVEEIYKDEFIQGMINATLSKEAVEHYLRADATYLSKFADVYAIILSRVSGIEDKRFFLSQIDFILNKEVEAHHILANYVGKEYSEIIKNADWFPTSDHYIKHMYYQLSLGSPAYVLSAMLPCPWIYREVCRKIVADNNISSDNPFKGWIDFYCGDLMDLCMEKYGEMINRLSRLLPDEEKTQLVRVFLESCRHERDFFRMAYKQEDWEEVIRNVKA